MDIGIINSLLGRPFVLGHQIRPALETLAHSLCGVLGLQPVTIIWDRKTQTASMDSGGRLRIVNPADDARINRALFVKYVGFVVHELLHRKYTSFSFLCHAAQNSGVSNPRYLHALHNGLEDGWIERKGIKEGFVGNIETVLHQLLKLVISESGQADWSNPANYPFILAVKARQFPGITVPCPVELEPIFAEAIRRLATSNSTNENVVIARWVYDQIQQLQPEPQNPPQDSDDDKSDPSDNSEEDSGEESKDGESGDDSESDSEGDEGGSGSGEEDGDSGSDSGSDGDEEGDEEGSQKGSGGSQSDDQGAGEGEGAPRPSVGPARPFDANTQPREVEPNVELGNGQAGPGTFNSTRHVFEDGFHVDPSAGRSLAPAKAQLRNALRRAFENTDQTDWDKGRKFGAFDIRAAQRWATGSVNVFQRRREQGGIRSAVLILVDCSSSMNVALDAVRPPKSKMLLAKECAAAIYESLSAAGVDTGIMTFCDGVSVAVKIGTPWPKAKPAIERLKTAGSTNDWQAVSACHHILFNRPEERRVLLVLTDGEGNRNDVRRQCQIGEALGITTIGVGIGVGADCYPNNVRVDSAAQLAESAIGKLIQAA